MTRPVTAPPAPADADLAEPSAGARPGPPVPAHSGGADRVPTGPDVTVPHGSAHHEQPEPADRRIAVPAAEESGLLTCGICRRPRRDLAAHIRRMHGMSVREYRLRVGLPLGGELIASGPYPRATAVQAAAVITRDEGRAAAARAGLDARARELGHDDLETLIQATAQLSANDVGALLRRSAMWARQWRRTFGVRGAPAPAGGSQPRDTPPARRPAHPDPTGGHVPSSSSRTPGVDRS